MHSGPWLCAAAVVAFTAPAFAQGDTPIGATSDPAPAPAPAPATSPAAPSPPPPEYVATPAPEPSWPQRHGFTLELGIGPAYTTTGGAQSVYDGGFGLAPLSLTVGGFVSRNVSLGARFGGTSFFTDARGSNVQVLNGFYGPAMQIFLGDYVFLGAGAGLGLYGVNPLSTNADRFPKLKPGFSMTGRAGFAFLARTHHWLGVVLEAYPAFYDGATVFGMSSILEWQTY